MHTIEEYRVVPWGPNADEMWELGKLTSERLGVLLKVYRAGRRYGLALEERPHEPDRHFMLDGLTTKEAAALLGIPQGTVKTRAARARREMREALA